MALIAEIFQRFIMLCIKVYCYSNLLALKGDNSTTERLAVKNATTIRFFPSCLQMFTLAVLQND